MMKRKYLKIGSVSLLVTFILLVRCGRLKGTYIDKAMQGDTLFIFDRKTYKYVRQSELKDTVKMQTYHTENGNIYFYKWSSTYFPSGSIYEMDIDRPLFRSEGIRIVYNSDLENGYFLKIK